MIPARLCGAHALMLDLQAASYGRINSILEVGSMRFNRTLGLIVIVVLLLAFIPSQGAAQSYSTNLEWQIFEMVNQERTSRGLPPLQMDSRLRDIARGHSKDMGDNNFFSHTSPTTGTFFQRLNNNNINRFSAGENIHWNSHPESNTAAVALNGWMTSTQGHRETILDIDPQTGERMNYSYTGIGVYRTSGGRYYYTQVFIGATSPPSTIINPPGEPDPTPPDPPNQRAPADGSTVTGNRVTFQWDPAPGATYYWIQVRPTHIYVDYVYQKVGNVTSFTWDNAPADGTEVMWQVMAGNEAGDGYWSGFQYFTSAPASTSPPAPRLLYPPNNSHVPGTEITFRWEPSPGASRYLFEITWGNQQSEGETEETSMRVTGFNNSGTEFRWRVTAIDSAGRRGVSNWYSFTNGTDSSPPDHYTSLIYWQHLDGSLGVWYMDRASWISGSPLNPDQVDPSWQVKAVIDMNGNGHSDIVWQNTDGRLSVWYMNGLDRVRVQPIMNPTGQDRINPDWDMKAVYDLNNNGSPDIVWQAVRGRHKGQLAIWFMNGLTAVDTGRLTHGAGLATIDPSWQLKAVHDLMGNGKPEVLWQAVSGPHRGQLAYWTLDRYERSGGGRLTQVGGSAYIDPSWQMRAVGDLLNDGKPEIIWHRNDGALAYWRMNRDVRVGGSRFTPDSANSNWRIVGLQ